jgi:hypothetical protein
VLGCSALPDARPYARSEYANRAPAEREQAGAFEEDIHMRLLVHGFTLLTVLALLAWPALSAASDPAEIPELEPMDEQEIDDLFSVLEKGDDEDDE